MNQPELCSVERLRTPALTPRNIRNFFAKVRRGGGGCREWTGGRDSSGYGVFTVDGVVYNAAHIALILDGRPRPKAPRDQALHGDCSNPGCVHPEHLRWGSNQENVGDKERLGRAAYQRVDWRPNSKLTEDDVRMIRNSPETGRALAARLGVSTATISVIRSRKQWRNVS